MLLNEDIYRSMFIQNPQPGWVYDIATLEFLEVNVAAINHYGYSKEEFLKMTLKDIRPSEDIPFLLEKVKQSILPFSNMGESRHITKTGQLIYVEVISHAVNFNGRSARHSLVHDITDRKLAQQELDNERNLLRTIINNIPHAIYLKDLDSRKVIANKADIENMELVTEDQVIGKTDFDVFPHDEAIMFFSDDQEVIRSKKPVLNREEKMVMKNGYEKWLSTSKIP